MKLRITYLLALAVTEVAGSRYYDSEHSAIGDFYTNRADITAFPGSTSAVKGAVVVFADGNTGAVGYAGFASGLATNLTAANCTDTNGCGVHIHSGKSSTDTTTPGPHYFVNPPVPTDP